MKKITKIWLLSLALAACLTVLNANADTLNTKQVSLTLSGWNNTCIIDNYNFGQHQVSPADQDLTEISTGIVCTFLENAASTVSLQLADVTASEWTITADNFSIAVVEVSHQWLISALPTTTTTNFTNATTPISIYNKELNKLWAWTWTLTVGGVIPGWTPMWSYAGNLDLLITPAS